MYVINLKAHEKQISVQGSILLMLLSLMGCTNNDNMENNDSIFPKGDLAPAENFTGNACNVMAS